MTNPTRRILSIFTVLTLASGLLGAISAAEPPLPALEGQAAVEHLKNEGLHASLGEALAAARYSVWPDGDEASADNRRQGYRTYFGSDQVRVVTDDQDRLHLTLAGWGYGERLHPVGPGELSHAGDRAEIARPGITEWYVNRRAGLEQGFTVEVAPGERIDDERLRVLLAVEGDLAAELDRSGGTVLLRDDQGGVAMRYSGLVAWDRTGRKLPASLVVPHGYAISIEVDDRDAIYPVTIDPVITTEVAKLEASDKEDGDNFGFSVALSGDTAIVGAPFEDDSASDSGAAYIFSRNKDGAEMWGEVAKLEALDGTTDDWFGWSVALSGDTAIVGAPFENDSGAAYIFSRNAGGAEKWGQVAKLEASDEEAGDVFGLSVALSGDTAIVGAYREDDPGSDSGAAYIFSRNKDGAEMWGQVAKLEASDKEEFDEFGISVALSGDTAIVGAHRENDSGSLSGAAYIFSRNKDGAEMWGQVAKLEASDGEAGDRFGSSVALSGDTAIVGAPLEGDPGIGSGAAYIFSRNKDGAEKWGEVAKLEASDKESDDRFGISVALSGDTAIVGAILEDDPGNSGAAYIFSRNVGGADNWGEVAKLEASDKEAGDWFGISVALSGDTAIVGAYLEDDPGSYSGAAYTFSNLCGDWVELKKAEASDKEDGDNFGYSVALSGDTAIVGAHREDDPGIDSGAAYIFSRNEDGAEMWGQVAKLEASDKEEFDEFGISVALSGDTAIVGAPLENDLGFGSGAAYIFSRNEDGAEMWGEVVKLEASDKAAGDFFGYSVALSGDTAIVGAYLEDDPGIDSGAAYIFSRNAGGVDSWGEVAKLEASDKEEFDFFGFSVALSGDTAIVGALNEDDPGSFSGAAYIFSRNEDGAEMWGQVAKLEASDAAAGDFFGYSVALSGDTAIVGAPFEDDLGFGSGAAYIFSRNEDGAEMWGEVAKLEASDKAAGDFFGISVALSGDTAIVGAFFEDDPGSDSGAAYIFSRNEDGAEMWGQVAKLEASDKESGDEFGSSVALSGDTAIVGARWEDDPGDNSGAAYFFKLNCPPQVSPQAVAVDQGGSVDDGTLATIIDDLTPSGDLLFDLPDPLPPGIHITDLTSTDGTITADVDVDCGVAFGDYLVVIDVTDEHGETSSAMFTISVGGIDTDGDGSGDLCDADDDNDGVLDLDDPQPLDVNVCGLDGDDDGCDDCAVGVDGFGPLADNDPANDGPDADGDGLCDSGDADDDNDGVLDLDDPQPLDVNVCGLDGDGDGCDDCAVGVDGFGPLADNDPANDGPDADGDGLCDAGDGLLFSPSETQTLPSRQVFEEGVYGIAPPGTGPIEDFIDTFIPFQLELDALDYDGGDYLYFSVKPGGLVAHAGGTIQLFEGNVYRVHMGTGVIEPALEWGAEGIGVDTLDGVTRLSAGKWAFSVDERKTVIDGAGRRKRLFPANVYQYNSNNGKIKQLFKLSEIGVSNADAVHVISSTRVGFSVDEVTYIPLTSGINRLFPSRVYIYDKSDGSLVESFSGSGYDLDGIDAVVLGVGLTPACP